MSNGREVKETVLKDKWFGLRQTSFVIIKRKNCFRHIIDFFSSCIKGLASVPFPYFYLLINTDGSYKNYSEQQWLFKSRRRF